MKITKIALLSLSSAILAFAFSSCQSATNNNATNNSENKANTAIVNNSNSSTANNSVPTSNADESKPSGIRDVDFLNFTYQSSVCSEDLEISKTIKVSKGKFQKDDSYYNIIDNKIIYGDVNGDGNEDAVVQIICGSNAGSLKSFEVHAFTNKDGKADLPARLDGGAMEKDYKKSNPDGFLIALGDNDVKIEKNHLIVEVLADGSNASPENVATFDYKFTDGKFVLDGKPQITKDKAK